MKDITKHDLDQHTRPPLEKSPEWYKLMNLNECPVCHAPVEFSNE